MPRKYPNGPEHDYTHVNQVSARAQADAVGRELAARATNARNQAAVDAKCSISLGGAFVPLDRNTGHSQ